MMSLPPDLESFTVPSVPQHYNFGSEDVPAAVAEQFFENNPAPILDYISSQEEGDGDENRAPAFKVPEVPAPRQRTTVPITTSVDSDDLSNLAMFGAKKPIKRRSALARSDNAEAAVAVPPTAGSRRRSTPRPVAKASPKVNKPATPTATRPRTPLNRSYHKPAAPVVAQQRVRAVSAERARPTTADTIAAKRTSVRSSSNSRPVPLAVPLQPLKGPVTRARAAAAAVVTVEQPSQEAVGAGGDAQIEEVTEGVAKMAVRVQPTTGRMISAAARPPAEDRGRNRTRSQQAPIKVAGSRQRPVDLPSVPATQREFDHSIARRRANSQNREVQAPQAATKTVTSARRSGVPTAPLLRPRSIVRPPATRPIGGTPGYMQPRNPTSALRGPAAATAAVRAPTTHAGSATPKRSFTSALRTYPAPTGQTPKMRPLTIPQTPNFMPPRVPRRLQITNHPSSGSNITTATAAAPAALTTSAAVNAKPPSARRPVRVEAAQPQQQQSVFNRLYAPAPTRRSAVQPVAKQSQPPPTRRISAAKTSGVQAPALRSGRSRSASREVKVRSQEAAAAAAPIGRDQPKAENEEAMEDHTMDYATDGTQTETEMTAEKTAIEPESAPEHGAGEAFSEQVDDTTQEDEEIDAEKIEEAEQTAEEIVTIE